MQTHLFVRQRNVEADPSGSRSHRRLRLPSALTRGLGVYCADTAEKVVALTYDDGPDPEHTPGLLDMLRAREATATFFVLGERVERHPEIARRIVAEGHELGVHGYDHRSLLTMPQSEVVASVQRAKSLVETTVGVSMRLFRPPYGTFTLRQAQAMRRSGMDLVMWSSVAEDWVHDAERAIADRALTGLRPGGILLLHDSRADPESLQAGEVLPRFDKSVVLSQLLDGIYASGYATVTVSALLDNHRKVRSVSRGQLRWS
jgi:peptidoglycan-N-acetylglucosamine deacetylase